MRAKIQPVLAECIENGAWLGYERAHKHTDEPNQVDLLDQIERAIWELIDERFEFDVQKTEENEQMV